MDCQFARHTKAELSLRPEEKISNCKSVLHAVYCIFFPVCLLTFTLVGLENPMVLLLSCLLHAVGGEGFVSSFTTRETHRTDKKSVDK